MLQILVILTILINYNFLDSNTLKFNILQLNNLITLKLTTYI